MQIEIKVIENGKIPEYKTIGSAGADCYARLEKEITIKAGRSEMIPLGFAVEIPAGYEMQIRGRSGLARKNNIDCFLGTIDSDYRGEVCAIILNKGQEDFTIKPSDRIAQAVIAPVIHADWKEVKELSETERGEKGFGSTGISEKEKFYEPFKNQIGSISLSEKLLEKIVRVDNEFDAKFISVFLKNNRLVFEFDTLGNKEEKYLYFTSLDCFNRVKVDNHRFGQEIKSDD